MKKNVLALSITAALVGLGFAGGAQAIGVNTGGTIPLGNASELRASPNGIGHFLFVPYYTVQAGNTTMINIVNTDTQNGKAVKVRFRGAANSDDVFDFQVFLSPGDVWTASLGKNASGVATFHTDDNSCTKPIKSILNSTAFITQRLDPALSGDALANQTREGYVEIFNMADIPKYLKTGAANPLYAAVKHVATGVAATSIPTCGNGSGSTWTAANAAWLALDTDLPDLASAWTVGLDFPSTGLMGGWIILNLNDAGAWSQTTTAIVANDNSGNRAPSTGNLVYFPQKGDGFGGVLTKYTADPVLIANPTMAAMFDVPDFSIPYLSTSASPSQSVSALTSAIATTKVYNEFLTKSAINSTTDWTLSMPTRRYWAAYDYDASDAAGVDVIDYNDTSWNTWFRSGNTEAIGRQVCVKGMSPSSYDQEENTPTGSGTIVSPGKPGQVVFCGEVNVMSVNNGEIASAGGLITSASGVLKATVARSALENGYSSGWIALATPGMGMNGVVAGLPILGNEFVRAVGSGAGATFGATWEHRWNRSQR